MILQCQDLEHLKQCARCCIVVRCWVCWIAWAEVAKCLVVKWHQWQDDPLQMQPGHGVRGLTSSRRAIQPNHSVVCNEHLREKKDPEHISTSQLAAQVTGIVKAASWSHLTWKQARQKSRRWRLKIYQIRSFVETAPALVASKTCWNTASSSKPWNGQVSDDVVSNHLRGDSFSWVSTSQRLTVMPSALRHVG